MVDDEYWKMICVGSATHRVVVTEHAIQLFPVDDTLEALRAFQPMAEEVLKRCDEDGGAEVIQHFTSLFPGRLRDNLVVTFVD